jgi:tetratricopeptide (TPR) repeat protein
MSKTALYAQRVLYFSYLALFFFTPFLFYPLTKFFPFPWILFNVDPLTYELFEFNKMYFVYGITVIIGTAWALTCVADRRIVFRKTFLDYPLSLFLLSQVLSTIFSIDIHTSLWGYYSRFHGGLISSICYTVLYWGLVSNLFQKKYVHHFLFTSILSGTIVSLYGIGQHFGVDADFWVQNVRARVFSTLGQPNWLSAYLAALFPLSISYFLYDTRLYAKIFYFASSVMIFSSFLYTASRSGLLALITAMLLYAILLYYYTVYQKRPIGSRYPIAPFLFFIAASSAYVFVYYKRPEQSAVVSLVYILLLFGILFGAATRINKYFICGLALCLLVIGSFAISPDTFRFGKAGVAPTHTEAPLPEEAGGTETGRIRFIVWKGAWEIFKRYPVLGSGVESFAYSFYQYRPIELLKTTEWDFLYNKAHNEYLNVLATTGLFGVIVYLYYIFSIFRESGLAYYRLLRVSLPLADTSTERLVIQTKASKKIIGEEGYFTDSYNFYMIIGLICGFITILITNFFGFSVVNIALFFFLFPAFIAVTEQRDRFSLGLYERMVSLFRWMRHDRVTRYSFVLEIAVLSVGIILFSSVFKYWFADIHFARGREYNRDGHVGKAYAEFVDAIKFRKDEPYYYSEVGWTQGAIVYQFAKDKDASEAATLAPSAAHNAEKAVQMSPNNVSYWKKLADTYYNLSSFDEREYSDKLRTAADRTRTLAPTDVSTLLVLSTYYEHVGDVDTAIKIVEQSTKWKPDLGQAWFRLGEIYYHRYLKTQSNDDKTKSEDYHYRATEVDPQNEEWKSSYE